MSALPPKADIRTKSRNVRFVPNSDIALECAQLKFLKSSFLSGLRRDRPLHRRNIGDGAHPTRELPTAGSEIAKPALARHLDGDG
jgi:hypothetical protein